MHVLVVNAGSSSLKLRLLDPDDEVVWTRDLDAGSDELEDALAEGGEADASGHRIVHGGPGHTSAAAVDDALLADLRALTELAPLHQPPALDALEAVRRGRPELPAVACFDTAFHATLPEAARTYALPAEWRERYGLRRYGFHGLSHAYASRRAAELVDGARRIVTCHLGAGASLAAVRDGRSVDTTMGFTPLAGLVMATRSGDVDPGILAWLLERDAVDAGELNDALERRSGLLGLAGTADMREVIDAAGRGDDAARLAFDVYVHRLRSSIGAMVASLGGVDALVFTGGVGEHAPEVRDAATDGLGLLGDAAVLVIEAREDLEIARRRALGAARLVDEASRSGGRSGPRHHRAQAAARDGPQGGAERDAQAVPAGQRDLGLHLAEAPHRPARDADPAHQLEHALLGDHHLESEAVVPVLSRTDREALEERRRDAAPAQALADGDPGRGDGRLAGRPGDRRHADRAAVAGIDRDEALLEGLEARQRLQRPRDAVGDAHPAQVARLSARRARGRAPARAAGPRRRCRRSRMATSSPLAIRSSSNGGLTSSSTLDRISAALASRRHEDPGVDPLGERRVGGDGVGVLVDRVRAVATALEPRHDRARCGTARDQHAALGPAAHAAPVATASGQVQGRIPPELAVPGSYLGEYPPGRAVQPPYGRRRDGRRTRIGAGPSPGNAVSATSSPSWTRRAPWAAGGREPHLGTHPDAGAHHARRDERGLQQPLGHRDVRRLGHAPADVLDGVERVAGHERPVQRGPHLGPVRDVDDHDLPADRRDRPELALLARDPRRELPQHLVAAR